MIAWMVLLSAFLAAAGLCWRFLQPGSRLHLLDHPNHRSLHQQAKPRSGGVAIVVAIISAMFVAVALQVTAAEPLWLWLLAGVLMLSLVGLADDYSHVSPLVRFAVHFSAAGLLLLAGLGMTELQLPGYVLALPDWLAPVLEFGFIVWMINLYNFMDGMDGFAGGMSVIGFASLSVLGALGGEPGFSLLSGVIAASAAGFLLWNFPPAKIFMGDAGAPVLGYLAAALSLWGVKLALFPLWIAVLVFSPFIVDASYTLVLRLVRKEKVWQAHREHIYQQLVQLGWGHRRTVLWGYCLMLGAAATAVYLVGSPVTVQWLGILFWVFAYGVIILAAKMLLKHSRTKGDAASG